MSATFYWIIWLTVSVLWVMSVLRDWVVAAIKSYDRRTDAIRESLS